MSLAALSVHVHAAAPATKTVTIKAATGGSSYVFTPASKTITVGTKVVWKNPTAAPHTVTSKTSSWKFNKQLMQGKTLSFTFKKAGTYKYHCLYHPGMTGKIIVKM
jgi:plastocyanin